VLIKSDNDAGPPPQRAQSCLSPPLTQDLVVQDKLMLMVAHRQPQLTAIVTGTKQGVCGCNFVAGPFVTVIR